MFSSLNYLFYSIKKKCKLNNYLIRIILKYNSNINNKIISQQWYIETEKIHKKSVLKIERWYKKFLQAKYLNSDLEFFNKSPIVRLYNYKYPTKYLLNFPENVVKKNYLHKNLLQTLKIQKYRNRSDVIKWLSKSEIKKNYILIAGW